MGRLTGMLASYVFLSSLTLSGLQALASTGEKHPEFAENLLESEPAYQFKGQHFLGSYYGCNHTALTDVAKLEEVMLSAAKASGATILSYNTHIFLPNAMTMVILLSESHASIHTYPEFNAVFVDLFTCGTSCISEKFNSVLSEYLQPERIKSEERIRD